jgi:nitroreductase
MDLYEAIYSRRTIRDFTDREIDAETLRKIIGAGLQAPSNNHMREWEFIVVRDRASRLELISEVDQNCTKEDAVRILNSWGFTDKSQREMYIDAIPKQYRMLLDASCIIIPCFRQKRPLLKPESLSGLNSFASIWCCIENILLAAASEGIYGVTWIPGTEAEHIKSVAGIPGEYEFPCFIALGYPSENAKHVSQLQVEAEDRIHIDRWGNSGRV